MNYKDQMCVECDGAGARRCNSSPTYNQCHDAYDCNRDEVFGVDAFREDGICFWTCRKCNGVGTIRVKLTPLEQLARQSR